MLFHRLRRFIGPLARPLSALLRRLRYRRALRRREPAGELSYVWSEESPPESCVVEARFPATSDRAHGVALCDRQTLTDLRAVGLDGDGAVTWQVVGAPHATEAEVAWFYAPGPASPPTLDPAFLETALLLLAAEAVDALTLLPDPPGSIPQPETVHDLLEHPWRAHTLFCTTAYAYDPRTDRVLLLGESPLGCALAGDAQTRRNPSPTRSTLPSPARTGCAPSSEHTRAETHKVDLSPRLIKVVPPADPPREASFWGHQRRGPFLADAPLPPRLEIAVRNAAGLRRRPPHAISHPAPRPAVLVLAPFLARGGAEQTLFATLHALKHRFDFTFITLAPHLPERGDRRDDFRRISPRLFSLGDQVHPAAMPGILLALLDATGAEILYNANGTTLFYDFAPRLKAARPGLFIVDHLYDHRVGYIEQYDRPLLDSVDACVAENHRIRDVLIAERGWPAERVPVIWPCGRADDAFPTGDEANAVRQRLRRELGLDDEDVVLLTAARMHPQKRPLDLVRLAERLHDLPQVLFLLVGGGELEDEVDAAIAATHTARVRRLPFRTDIPHLLLASDAGCLVSDYEGLPVFLLESLQAGRPFLGTDVGDLGRVLRATGAGPVVDRPGDLDALESAVHELADPVRRAALAERARAAAPAFGVEACAERYARVLLGDTKLPPYAEAKDTER